MFREDYHLHSRFSPDSTEEPEKIIKTAYEKGLERIIFTEHCEANLNEAMPEGKPAWPPLDIPAYTAKIEELKKTAPMSVGIGIELGQATFALENAEKALNAYDWDFVLGSMHNIRNGIDFYAHFLEFFVVVGQVAQFGRTYERKVCRIEENDAPFTFQIVVGHGDELAIVVSLCLERFDLGIDQ